MNEKEKREKVIAGLKEIAASGWMFRHADYYQMICKEALTLLKAQEQEVVNLTTKIVELTTAQEPRVMSLEEVQKLQRNDVVWLDERAGKQVIPVLVRSRYIWPYSTVMVIDFLDSHGCTITVSEVDLLFRDRCWTSRPTDEQREATAWN